MKVIAIKILSVLLLLCFSCKGEQQNPNINDFANGDTIEVENDVIEPQNRKQDVTEPKTHTGNYQYFENFDPSVNMVSGRVTLPKGWKRLKNDKQYQYEGPNDMKIGRIQMSNLYSYTEDYGMLQTYQMSGTPNQYPMSINQIVETFFMPYANENNLKFIGSFSLPKVAEKSKAFLDLNFKSQPTQIETESAGLEWQDDKGRKYLTILRKTIYKTYNQLSWGFLNQHIESPASKYEDAKKIFINMTLSEQHNTDWLYRKNQIAAQKANQQFRAHQARMDAIKLNSSNSGFSSSVVNTYSDILDISHSGYLKRSNMTSHDQSRTVNMIGERNIISNHNTGEHYNVQAGSKYYWVNNNGKYFGTDNPNYDPRIDQRINQTEWSQFNIEN
ncbi:MAG: hypothetical protein ACX93I_11235 [Winogradskyella sp.]